jgi:hypothetical protein
MITYSEAIMSLAPNVDFAVNGEEITEWNSEDVAQPSHEDILAEKTRLQAEYDDDLYKRDRENLYPKIGDQLDMLYHAIDADETLKTQFADFYNAIKAVKDNNPKPSE